MTTHTSAPIVFCDTETDGIHPDRKPWEIALIRRDPDGVERECSFFVDIDLSTADPFGLRVGRFYDRHPLGLTLSAGPPPSYPVAVSSETAALKVAKLTHGAHIVGAVPNFDTEILARLLRDHGLCPTWNYHLIDIKNLAVGWLAGHGRPQPPPWNSDDLTAALGLPPVLEQDRHTALGDARWARDVYDRVMSGDRAVTTQTGVPL